MNASVSRSDLFPRDHGWIMCIVWITFHYIDLLFRYMRLFMQAGNHANICAFKFRNDCNLWNLQGTGKCCVTAFEIFSLSHFMKYYLMCLDYYLFGLFCAEPLPSIILQYWILTTGVLSQGCSLVSFTSALGGITA